MGLGLVHSWVRYHRAYVPAFEPLLPYSAVSVEPDEGPRLFGRFTSSGLPKIGLRVQTVAERWTTERVVTAFAAVDPVEVAT